MSNLKDSNGAPNSPYRPSRTECGIAYGCEPYGDGGPIVVRDGESPSHGEGGQVFSDP